MREHTETTFGFLWVEHADNRHLIDVLVPQRVLQALKLIPGSPVMVCGLREEEPEVLYFRPFRKASQKEGIRSFTSVIRLPNRPNILSRFLSAARQNGIKFELIQNTGTHSESGTDVFCEGHLISNNSPVAFSIEDEILYALENATGELRGAVTRVWSLKDSRAIDKIAVKGKVETSLFRLNSPPPSIFNNPFGLMRANTQGTSRTLKNLEQEPQFRIVRLHASYDSSVLTIDFKYTKTRNFYELSYSCQPVEPAYPIVMKVVEALSENCTIEPNVNIELVEAIEYLKYFPTTKRMEPRLVASIGILFSTSEPVDKESLLTLRKMLKKKSKEISSSEEKRTTVRLDSVSQILRSRRIDSLPRDRSNTPVHGLKKSLLNGRYEFIAAIGKGGFGDVNSLLDTYRCKVVAGKHLKRTEDQKYLHDTVTSESAILSELSHPNIAALLDSFQDGIHPVAIIEHCDNILENHFLNPSSRNRMSALSHPQNIQEFYELLLQLTSAIKYVHERGFVHCDISPDNIGVCYASNASGNTLEQDLSGSLRWKLFDFGAAKRIDAESRETRLALKHEFASPQARRSILSKRNDVFSLGVVAYYILSGWKKPYGERQNLDLPRRLEIYDHFRRDLSPEGIQTLSEIVDRMIASEESDRPESKELSTTLQEWGAEHINSARA